MKKQSVPTLKIAATYIGTVVGAGFATGQEILQFFAGFGITGLWGIALTTFLFILFGFIIMELGQKLYAQSHLEIIKASGGKILGFVMDAIITFFLFGSLTAMAAGTGALFSQQFGIPGLWGSLLMAVLAGATVLTGIGGVINAISVIVPFLLVSVVGISVFSIVKAPPDMAVIAGSGENGLIHNWFLAGILYVSYNTVMSISVLGPLGAHSKDKRAILAGAVLGGSGLGLGAVMIFFALCGNLSQVRHLEVPMSYIAGNISPVVQIIYTVVLIAEVYTTAVGALYGFAARVADMEKNPGRGRTVVVGTAAAAFFASMLGFSNLVKYLYPLVGYGGIVLLLSLLWGRLREPTD